MGYCIGNWNEFKGLKDNCRDIYRKWELATSQCSRTEYFILCQSQNCQTSPHLHYISHSQPKTGFSNRSTFTLTESYSQPKTGFSNQSTLTLTKSYSQPKTGFSNLFTFTLTVIFSAKDRVLKYLHTHTEQVILKQRQGSQISLLSHWQSHILSQRQGSQISPHSHWTSHHQPKTELSNLHSPTEYYRYFKNTKHPSCFKEYKSKHQTY